MSEEIEQVPGEEDQDDLRAIISSAVSEEKPQEVITEAATPEPKGNDVPGNEGGTAPPKSPEKVIEAAEPPPAEKQGSEEWSSDRAPSSWSPKMREKWGALDADVRNEIVRREKAAVDGVRQLHEQYTPMRNFAESLRPFLAEAQQMGVNPAQHVHNVLVAERQLRTNDPAAKLNALLSIADQYGIPIRGYIKGEQPVPQAAPPQVAPEQIAALVQQQVSQQASVQAELQKVVGKEFFSDVQDTMADLIEIGRAQGVEDAYEMALKLHPEIQEVLTKRQQEQAQQAQRQQRQQMAAAAGAAGAASGTFEVPGGNDKDDSIRGIIARALTESQGRI